MLHRLVARLDLPSYLPKPEEILDGVQWLRENPGLAAGVMVGLTSYSVAKYYELIPNADAGQQEEDEEETVTQEEIARSISAIQLGLLKVGFHSADTVDSLDSSTSSAFGLRRRTSSVFKPVAQDAHVAEEHASVTCWCASGSHVDANGEKKACCDPDWGWFVPTSPRP
ncbi:hypothetical protein FI667_g508, partial [Globisporangium splendens]